MNSEVFFDGLDLISQNKQPFMPLDPIILDCGELSIEEISETIKGAIEVLVMRIKRMSIQRCTMALVGEPQLLDRLSLDTARGSPLDNIKVIVESNLPEGTAFLLTKEVDGQETILPGNGLTWEEYFLEIRKGNHPPLSVTHPWLQARLENIRAIEEAPDATTE